MKLLLKKPRVKLELWKKTGKTIAAEPIEIDEFLTLNLTNSYVLKNDTFALRLPVNYIRNETDTYDYSITKYYGAETTSDEPPIKAEDRIKIYAWKQAAKIVVAISRDTSKKN